MVLHSSEVIKNIFLGFVAIIFLNNCGKAYFPIELKTVSRSERTKEQQPVKMKLITLTDAEILKSNKEKYKRYVVLATDTNKPASIIPLNKAIVERVPQKIEPSPYKLSPGDIVTYKKLLAGSSNVAISEIPVSDTGFIQIYGIGNVLAQGKSQSELQDEIYKQLIRSGDGGEFELSISGFNSKKIYVSLFDRAYFSIPYTSITPYLVDLLAPSNNQYSIQNDLERTFVELWRDNQKYTLLSKKVFLGNYGEISLLPGDKISIKNLNFKKEAVVVVGETGAQKTVPLKHDLRPTLSDILFDGRVLNTVSSDFSQIYVIRKKEKFFHAYHLDVTNPARIQLSKKLEMRPDDIVFVAAQPLSLYSRTLSQILGSTGLTLQARDTIRSEIGN
tara:strand:+ start:690 stop:1856 length:1167 start_codon:yes stop_codon:yes gene_type:complete